MRIRFLKPRQSTNKTPYFVIKTKQLQDKLFQAIKNPPLNAGDKHLNIYYPLIPSFCGISGRLAKPFLRSSSVGIKSIMVLSL